MEADVKCGSSKKKKGDALVRPSELHFLTAQKSTRLGGETLYSPVTELSMNLGGLSTDTEVAESSFVKPCTPLRLDDTPKRKVFSPSPVKPAHLLFGSGFVEDVPVSRKSKFGSLLRESNTNIQRSQKKGECRSAALARFKALPSPFCGLGSSPSTSCPVESQEDKENTSPAQLLGSPYTDHSPVFQVGADDTNSQVIDSGVGLDLPSSGGSCPSREPERRFKFPVAPAPRRHRIYSDEAANSPLKYSPAKNSPSFKGKLKGLLSRSPSPKIVSSPALSSSSSSPHKSTRRQTSPVKLRKSSLTCSPEDDAGDEGFLDLKELEQEDLTPCGISGLDKLLNAPVINNSLPRTNPSEAKSSCPRYLQNQLDESFEIKERPKSTRRGLFRSPSDPLGGFHKSKSFAFGASPSFYGTGVSSPSCCSPMFAIKKKTVSPRKESAKRNEPCADDEFTPMREYKRRKSVIGAEPLLEEVPDAPPKFYRSHSEAEIKHACSQADSQPDLVGDYSKPYCLPTIKGEHPDLKSISDDTMAKLLCGEYDHVVEKYITVDCRYPYEYDGGHIKGAKNIFTKEDILKTFLNSDNHRDYKMKDDGKRQILIFHCEFSQSRGPKLSRFLRNNDRSNNKNYYPFLHYPEIYLLHNGYKKFYHSQESLCEPRTYVPMMHSDHGEDLRKFRAKSKSWAGEQKCRQPFRSGLKF